MIDQITVTPCFESMAAVADHLRHFLDGLGIPSPVGISLQVCLDEILSNIVKFSGATRATVKMEAAGDMLYLHFRDDGIPFDPLDAQPPDPDDPMPLGGLGIFMVKETADALHYEYRDGCNLLTLGIQLPPKEDHICTNRPAP